MKATPLKDTPMAVCSDFFHLQFGFAVCVIFHSKV